MALFPPPAERDHQFTNAPEILDAALEAAAVPSNIPALSMCIDASPTLPREDAVSCCSRRTVLRLTFEW